MVDIEIFKAFGKIAGIGGLALATFLVIFRDIIRKNIFSRLSQKQSYNIFLLLIILTSTITLAGLASWLYAKVTYSKTPKPKVEIVFSGQVHDGSGNPILGVHIIFDPLDAETWSRADGTFAKRLVIQKLYFPLTLSAMHDDYYTFETVVTIKNKHEHINIPLERR